MPQKSAAFLGFACALAVVSAPALADPAQVRVLHASPDAPAVDVLVNGGVVPALTDLAFRNITPYLPLPGGTYNFQVVPTGLPAPVVIDATLPIADDVTYTIAAVNFLSNIEPLVLLDDNTIAPGQARVRFVHASPNAPAVDIAVTGGPVVFPNVAFREFSSYLTLAPGSYDLEVRLAGLSDVVLSLPGVSLEGDRVYTVFATGVVGGSPSLDALITVDAIPSPGAAGLLALAGLAAARRRR